MAALPVPVVLGLQVVLLVAAAAAFGASRGRRALAWAFVLAGLVLPWLMVEVPPMRAFSALLAMFGPMRAIELAQRTTLPSLPLRVLTFLLPIDARTLRPAPPRFDTAILLHALVHATIGALGVVIVVFAGETGAAAPAVRLVGCVVALYGIVDALSNFPRLGFGLVGFRVAPMQIDPILSESAGDFWGRRWNRAVGDWLRFCCFVPIARRAGTRWGAVAAFFASAVLHFVPALAAVGWWSALACGGYFVIESLLVIVEGRLRVPLWRRPWRHAWAMVAILGPSPLFLIPVLQIFGGWERS